MKKLIILMALALTGCAEPGTKSKQPVTACKYTCTMHKDVCADKPGVCPKCGMDLVEKESK